MTSILTNTSAMTALQTLTQTNKNLATTQNRIATGQRVSTASDNAAYWSIATGMKAQNSALSAVKDSMGFGAAVVDTAYTALEEAIKKTEDMFSKYVAREQDGVDQAAIDAEITQLKEQVSAIGKNADFEGQNLLTGGTLNLVTGYIKGTNGAATTTPIAGLTADNTAAVAAAANDALESVVSGLNATELLAGESMTFNVGNKSYTINGGSEGMNNASLIGAISTRLAADGIAATWDGTDLTLAKTATAPGESIFFSGGDIVTGAGGVQSMTIAGFDLDAAMATVSDAGTAETALNSMKAAAAQMGANKMRIDSQMEFTGKLMDAVERGVGVLVDADMNAESARLAALQTQQQLGIQALSIANQSSQAILSLFR
ncbi:flagellin [Pseudaminobacter salicylatoxidans]|uniref:flagellin N-terminal helical domain-containing protein n=1 Tax=Pseudaminobacter salicylatoxidans TaxID=93369 RepID=UPI0002F8041C|nr:flagellin [Pseudaminobacter salicylatoxidans]